MRVLVIFLAILVFLLGELGGSSFSIFLNATKYE